MVKGVGVCPVSLIDLIKKEDDKYISINAFIKLVSNHTKDSNDLVIEYLGKFCLSDRYDQIGFYTKNSGNGYTSWLYLSSLICKDDKTNNHRFYTMSELAKNDRFLASYFLKDDIFNASFIKSLNLNPNIHNKSFTNIEDTDNPIERGLDQNDKNYTSVLRYVNDLGKGIGSGRSLKVALEYLIHNVSFSVVELYLYSEDEYILVSPANPLDYTTSIEILEGIYHSLDGSQRGINFSDSNLQPFKDFYFRFSELPDLRSSYGDIVLSKVPNQSNKRLPNQNLSEREKTGIPEVGYVTQTYDQVVKELITANNTIKDLKSKPAQVEAVKYSYTTPAMEIMNAVINEFWINYSPEQPAPKQSTITSWITQNFNISPALALNIDKVCRHSDAKSGGKYKRS